MLTAGIKELKDNLSRYLARVKKGEEILITERGKVIARIIGEESSKISLWCSFQSLASKGQCIMPTKELKREGGQRAKVKGRPVSDIVIEDRR